VLTAGASLTLATFNVSVVSTSCPAASAARSVTMASPATGDHQWIHVDPEKAAAGPFGAPIAHGYLTLSLFIPLFTELLDVQGVTTKVNYGLNKVRFPSPVKVGSRIRLVAKLTDVEEVPGGVQVTVDGAIEIEGGAKPAAVLQSLSRFYA
jgi:acyl dehydratase